MAEEKEMLGLLEPAAEEAMAAIRKVVEGGRAVPHEQMSQPLLMSLAISAKRIADAVERAVGDDGSINVWTKSGDMP